MKVTVTLYATLTKYHPEGKGSADFNVDLPSGSTVKDLYDQLGIGEGEAKQVFIKHKSRPEDYTLEEGERVAIFPPVAGG